MDSFQCLREVGCEGSQIGRCGEVVGDSISVVMGMGKDRGRQEVGDSHRK